MIKNELKQRLKSKVIAVVTGWLQIPSSLAAATAIAFHQCWDSLTIDMQHGHVIDYQNALANALSYIKN